MIKEFCDYKHTFYFLPGVTVRSQCCLEKGHSEKNHLVLDLEHCESIEVLPQPVPSLQLTPGHWLLGILGWPVKRGGR